MSNQQPEENLLNVQGYNIVTILKRLEAATLRLEDISIFQEDANQFPSSLKPVAPAPVEPTPVAPVVAVSAPAEKAKFVGVFDQFIKDNLDPFVKLSAAIDPVVGEAAENFRAAFVEQGKFLELVSETQKPAPTDAKFVECLAPINGKIEAVSTLKDANRRLPYFNHLNTVSEGAPVLGWIVSDAPVSFIPEFKDSAQFWSNRVMKEFKDKDVKHVQWVKQSLQIFDSLKEYVKEYHTTGPSWNAKGKPLAETMAKSTTTESKGPEPSSAGAPPPPPPPPATLFEEKAAGSSETGGMGAVFAALNKGENVTSGLKKVEKSQMTHKNPALRDAAAVVKKPTPPKKPTSLSTAPKVAQKKPPRMELVDGSKWVIENYTEADAPEPIVIEAEMHQSVFIGNATGITVQINGKANAVTISETKKTGVVVDSLISGIDVIKSFKFGIQVTGVVPLITVDKSDEGSIYLSAASLKVDALVVTSNTTALNINVPEEDDFAELSVPEQLKHSVKNGKLVSEVVEHAG